MIDADTERRVRDWLHADAVAWDAPASLRRRVLDLPSQPSARESWWHRFGALPAASGAMAVVLAAAVVGNAFIGLLDAPAGADGEACNNRQVQRALDAIRDASGYRYVSYEERRILDPDAEVDFANPTFVWQVTWTSDGAFAAPDRARDVPRTAADASTRGYLEHLQVRGRTYWLQDEDGMPTWFERTNWPTANLVWGYVANRFIGFSIPGVNALEWDAEVPADLRGEGGCLAAMNLPADTGYVGQIVALRVDVGTGRPMTTFIGPAVDAPANEGDTRSTWQISWEQPSPDEFVAPTDARPIDSFVAPPPDSTSIPIPISADAWQPTELPVPDGIANADSINVVGVARGDRWVAVGAAADADSARMVVWTSDDGVTWSWVDDLSRIPDGFIPAGIAWNGTAHLVMGYREHADGGEVSYRPETLLSVDGVTWELGGPVGPDVDSRSVANPGTPVAGGPGWVAGGSIFLATDAGQEQQPALFWSEDGRAWTTVELDGTRSGSIGQPVLTADGSLLAFGCESPSSSLTSNGECFTRPWRSDDGMAWEAGPVIDLAIDHVTPWQGRYLAVGSDDSEGIGGRIVVSSDGETWEAFAELPDDGYATGRIHVLGDTLLVEAWTTTAEGTSRALVRRWTEAGDWALIDLAPAADGDGVYLAAALHTDVGLVFVGEVVDTSDDGETVAQRPQLWIEP